MKFKIGIIFFLISLYISAQTVLTYEDHCYKINENYSYNLIEYIQPGEGGEHQVWDFSGIAITEKLDGEMTVGTHTLNKEWFPEGNISVEEFGNRFVFKSSTEGMKQVGYISKSNKTVIRYKKPNLKLKFPMHYTDSYTGEIEMENLQHGTVNNGTYRVTADAYGVIVLPDRKVFENALRVESLTTVKNADGSIQESKVYRWYIQSERFPVMVTQEIAVVRNKKKTSTSYKAAYNTGISESKSAKLGSEFTLQPNPAKSHVNISFSNPEEGEVNIKLFSLDGKLIDNVLSANLKPGEQQVDYLINSGALIPGTYIIKIQMGNTVQTASLIIQQ